MRCSAALAAGFALAVLSPRLALSEDATPQVAPDRIADVPSTRADPFPAFDNFAWRAFIALNWPALTDAADRGAPDRAKSLGDAGPRVWETFKARWEVFQPAPGGGPASPAAWTSYEGRNPCGAGADNRLKTLASFKPFADFNQADDLPGKFLGPLIAQNRTYVRYEVRINQAEFDSIVANRWFARDAAPTADHPAHFADGAIAVKAAWRILTDADPPTVRRRYYVVAGAQTLDVARTLAAGRPVCVTHDVALVGLHIAIKTHYRPQWLWSTFEHVDNVPPVGRDAAREPDARDAAAPYAFFDPAKPANPALLDPDSPLARPVGFANPPRLDPEPTQLSRKHPIAAETMAINRAYWALPEIRGTVWANYMLVAAQWPTMTQPPSPDNDGQYFPGLKLAPGTVGEPYQVAGAKSPVDENLVNTTIESFGQDAPASCMACHSAVSNALGRDFVGILGDAN